ncbi:MAG: aspartate aminotransferase family protein [Alphaproteobacteria bacterium]|nr:aspartate aminotransferase family protein [Alphaproteobacteria bacterium]
MDGRSLPLLRTPVPGPRSRSFVDRLARAECPAITARRARRAAALGVADTDPIVWESALGANVQDVDGNVYIDLTAGFGVAAAGHRDPDVVAALHAQADTLLHAMGDAFPDPRRIELLERLQQLTGMDRAILGSSGSDAVEAALKTARVATGRDGVLAFDRGYHGLPYGVLVASDYKADAFRGPFAGQLGPHVHHADFGGALPDVDWLATHDIGAVLVEPIQGRGGVRVPPPEWLASLRARCDQAGALLIFDEIYTGFGRTGRWFAFQDVGVKPDLLCVGKGMAGGFPISACLGTARAMDAWGASKGEALHTQTFLGNPLGCAMALASIGSIERQLPEVLDKGEWLRERLHGLGLPVRGRGLLLGIELPDGPDALATSGALLQRGFIVLPSGEARPGDDPRRAVVLCLTPPLCITVDQLAAFVDALADVRASA